MAAGTGRRPDHVTSLRCPFAQFADGLLRDQHLEHQMCYLQWRRLPLDDPSGLETVNKLVRQFRVPKFLLQNEIRETAMWIGRCRSSSIHFDAMDNIHCVLQGEKTFYLWDPWQITQMEMLPLAARADSRPIAAPTVYSILEPPVDQRLAAGMKCVTVSAGDALYIPMVSLPMCTAHC